MWTVFNNNSIIIKIFWFDFKILIFAKKKKQPPKKQARKCNTNRRVPVPLSHSPAGIQSQVRAQKPLFICTYYKWRRIYIHITYIQNIYTYIQCLVYVYKTVAGYESYLFCSLRVSNTVTVTFIHSPPPIPSFAHPFRHNTLHSALSYQNLHEAWTKKGTHIDSEQ